MDDDLYESCLEEVLAALKNKGFSFILKREQDSALRHLFKRKDVVAVLPTGFGKSLIFQLLVFLAKAKGRREGGEGFAAILVITPLTSIIQDQISEISSMGLSGCNLSEKLECLDDIPLACLPRARFFFISPIYFLAPATQATVPETCLAITSFFTIGSALLQTRLFRPKRKKN